MEVYFCKHNLHFSPSEIHWDVYFSLLPSYLAVQLRNVLFIILHSSNSYLLQTLIITNLTLFFFSGHQYSTGPMSKSYRTPIQMLLLTADSLSVAPFGGLAANQLCVLLASVIMIMYHSSLLMKISWSIWLNALWKTKHTSSSSLLPVWTELL